LLDFKKEFSQEAPKVINTAIFEKSQTVNVTSRFESFVQDFMTYARTKNTKLDIVYLLSYENKTYVGNHYGEQITAVQGNSITTISNGQITMIDRTSSIGLTIANYTYDFEIETGANVHSVMRRGTEIVVN
ncbi:MAG: hypothetical protein Q8O89_07475, partial [Nanoarchaeota archaeon]|nr:hypothetical protein [Nanoarchaeota archaeon]